MDEEAEIEPDGWRARLFIKGQPLHPLFIYNWGVKNINKTQDLVPSPWKKSPTLNKKEYNRILLSLAVFLLFFSFSCNFQEHCN